MEQQDWLDQFQRRVEDMRTKSQALQEKLENASATAQSRNGFVTVTVGPNGGLQQLVIDERAMRTGGLSAAALTSMIMETYGQAHRKAAVEVADALEPMAGGSDMMRVVRSFLPPPPDDDEDGDEDGGDDGGEPEPPVPPTPPPSYTAQPPPPPPLPPPPAAQPPARRRPSRPDDDDVEMDPW